MQTSWSLCLYLFLCIGGRGFFHISFLSYSDALVFVLSFWVMLLLFLRSLFALIKRHKSMDQGGRAIGGT